MGVGPDVDATTEGGERTRVEAKARMALKSEEEGESRAGGRNVEETARSGKARKNQDGRERKNQWNRIRVTDCVNEVGR